MHRNLLISSIQTRLLDRRGRQLRLAAVPEVRWDRQPAADQPGRVKQAVAVVVALEEEALAVVESPLLAAAVLAAVENKLPRLTRMRPRTPLSTISIRCALSLMRNMAKALMTR
jgi:hypothetical protein